MRDQLLGSTQPVLSIVLDAGESVVAQPGEFAWMTDSIQMTTGPAGLSEYTAKDTAGTVAFAARLPGSILPIDVTTGREYLVHRRAFLAGTPGIEVTTGFRQPLGGTESTTGEFVLRRIAGFGRAWVELSGDVVRRDLAAGTSLRTRPWHIGMSDSSVAVQMAELEAAEDGRLGGQHGGQYGGHFGSDACLGADTRHFAVLSGPGSVWLQSMPLLAAPPSRLTASQIPLAGPTSHFPAVEGAAGQISKIEVAANEP
jgi:uncharacterized protein (AIM24 family)